MERGWHMRLCERSRAPGAQLPDGVTAPLVMAVWLILARLPGSAPQVLHGGG